MSTRTVTIYSVPVDVLAGFKAACRTAPSAQSGARAVLAAGVKALTEEPEPCAKCAAAEKAAAEKAAAAKVTKKKAKKKVKKVTLDVVPETLED